MVELTKIVKENSILVRSIQKWQKSMNSTVLVRFVSQDGLVILCQYYEKLREVQSQITEILA